MKKLITYLLGIVVVALLVIPAKVFGIGLAAKATTAFMFNFSTVDFSDEEVRDMAEMILDEAMDQPEITQFHTVIQGLIANKQIVYAGLLEKITKKNEGCGTGATSKEIELRQKKWTPEKVKIWLQLCADELDQSLLIYAKNKGIKVDDLTDTQIAEFIIDRMKSAMITDLFRIVWFNDTDHSNVNASGGTNLITDTVDVSDYNIIDGFWKQIFAIAAATPARRVDISAYNGQATAALQDSTLEASDGVAAANIFRDIIKKAHPKLKGAKDKVIIATQSLVDAYADYLESKSVPASYDKIEGGYSVLKRRGVTIIGWNFWDDTIRADFDNGTTYNLPHRAVLTTPKNLQVGIDDAGAPTEVEMWYNQDEEQNNFRSKYKIDAKIAVDYMVQVAY
jgi:hypothetical protein